MRCQHEGCRCYALKGKQNCFNHDSESQEAHRLASVKGGSKKKKKAIEPIYLAIHDLKGILGAAIMNLQDSDSQVVSKTRALAYAASVLLDIIRTEELEQRLTELEKNYQNTNG